jgi:hypothetical protein
MGKAELSYQNSNDTTMKRGEDQFTLYPLWNVPLGFDKFYPGDVAGMIVCIWADTGEIATASPMIVDSSMGNVADDSKVQESNTVLGSLSAPILVTAGFSLVAILLGYKKKVFEVAGGRKMFSVTWTIILSGLIIVSAIAVAVPQVSATSRSRAYATLNGSVPSQVWYEQTAAYSVCDSITTLFSNAGYDAYNEAGWQYTTQGNTTKQNIYDDTYSDEQTCDTVSVFHFGHTGQFNIEYQTEESNISFAYDVNSQDIYSLTSNSHKHNFVFIWVCASAQRTNEPNTYSMSRAWLHRDNYLSSDGYGGPDYSGQCYIGFYDFSPVIGYSSPFMGRQYDQPCSQFIYLFYLWSVGEGLSVHDALDWAAHGYFGSCVFGDSPFQGYSFWWPGNGDPQVHLDESGYFPEHWRELYPTMYGNTADNHMSVFGDSSIHLSSPSPPSSYQLSVCAFDSQYWFGLNPNVWVDGNWVGTAPVSFYVSPGDHTVTVDDTVYNPNLGWYQSLVSFSDNYGNGEYRPIYSNTEIDAFYW